MLFRVLQTQHPVGWVPAIVTGIWGPVIGLGSHMAGPCDGRPLASPEWVSLYKRGWAPELLLLSIKRNRE